MWAFSTPPPLCKSPSLGQLSAFFNSASLLGKMTIMLISVFHSGRLGECSGLYLEKLRNRVKNTWGENGTVFSLWIPILLGPWASHPWICLTHIDYLSSVLYILFFFFWCGLLLKSFFNFVTILLLLYVLTLTTKHVGSSFPNKGLKPHHLRWKAKSQPLDQQGSPS